MRATMRYERDRGWHPEDVSHENLGFDVRSTLYADTRYIEVKARAGSGAIRLLANEWRQARNLATSINCML